MIILSSFTGKFYLPLKVSSIAQNRIWAMLFKIKITMAKYQSMTYTQLAERAGVSRRTLYNWLHAYGHYNKLQALGVTSHAKALPPAAVRYICETFCIEVE